MRKLQQTNKKQKINKYKEKQKSTQKNSDNYFSIMKMMNCKEQQHTKPGFSLITNYLAF